MGHLKEIAIKNRNEEMGEGGGCFSYTDPSHEIDVLENDTDTLRTINNIQLSEFKTEADIQDNIEWLQKDAGEEGIAYLREAMEHRNNLSFRTRVLKDSNLDVHSFAGRTGIEVSLSLNLVPFVAKEGNTIINMTQPEWMVLYRKLDGVYRGLCAQAYDRKHSDDETLF